MTIGTIPWFGGIGLFAAARPKATGAAPTPVELRIKRFCTTRYTTPDHTERAETRVNRRFVPLERDTFITYASGEQIQARVLNVSSLSVAIEADFTRVNGDAIVKVGTRRVKPGRSILAGRVFMFEKPLGERHCQPEIIL